MEPPTQLDMATAAPTTAPGLGMGLGMGMGHVPTPPDTAGGRKVSQTCVTCRARKVRCDGRRPLCSNCERLGFPCAFDDEEPPSTAGGASAAVGGAASTGHAGSGAADGILSIPRRRARQACQNCHSRKARCTGGTPQCDRCRALGIECVYRPGKRTRLSPVLTGTLAAGDRDAPPQPPPSAQPLERGLSESSDHADPLDDGTGAPGVPDGAAAGFGAANGVGLLPARACSSSMLDGLAMRTFDQFFRYLHHIPTFSFLHRASLMQRYRAGLMDRPLLLALVGITSLLTDLGPGTRELGKQCIAEAEALVLNRLDRPSTLGLQALVFVIHHRVLSGRFSSAFMLHGVASRFAAALRLNHENTRLCFLARESRRRLMWALFMIDSSMANGYADFSLWAYRADCAEQHTRADAAAEGRAYAHVMNIQLPCNERNFEFDLPERTEPLLPPPRGPDGLLPPLPDDIGFLALHVRIRSLRGRILKYTKDLASHWAAGRVDAMDVETAATHFDRPPLDVATIPARVADMAAELDDFAARLPFSFRWTDANVRLRMYSARMCVFLMTHVWWEQCHCELYRLGLAGLPEALPTACLADLAEHNPDFAALCRAQVREHASAMAEMFRSVLTLENGVPVTDLDLPICLYQCVRLLLYVSRTNPDDPQPGPQHDTFLELAGVCTQVLERTVTTPATLRIRANLQKLMTSGLSTADAAPSGRSTPEVVYMETDDDANEVPDLGPPSASAAAASFAPVPPRPPRPPRPPPQQQPLPPLAPLGRLAPPQPHAGGLPGAPVLFDALDTPLTAAGASSPAIGTVRPVAGPHPPPLTPAAGVSSASSPAPPSSAAASNAPGASLDAFDLDVDTFGGTDLGGWFSGDWVTNNGFSV